ncbi:MAG: 6-bladed beta-propeller [bacterium]|nr:6-bladed beta-propeller [bacterium]
MTVKRTITLICAVFLSAGLFSTLDADSFTKIRTIGDGENGGFILYSAHGVVVDSSKNIFVLDGKGHRLVKFNWQGKFLKQFGQKGRGPKDLLGPRDVSIFDNKLYIDDSKNHRIVVTDTELNYLDEIRWDMRLGLPPTSITRLTSSTFLGKNTYFEKGMRRLILLDDTLSKKKKEFFSYRPEKLDLQANFPRALMALRPVVGVNHKHKRILVTLRVAENSMRFFLYDFEGNSKGEFRYQQEAKFKLPLGFLHSRKDIHSLKEKFTYSMINAIHSYKGDFLVFIGQAEDFSFAENESPFRTHCLVFSHTGKFKKRMECYGDMAVLCVTPDGYVLGKPDNDQDVNVTIFKMEI